MAAGAPQRDRSPGYPIISLGEALERLAAFEAHFKRNDVAPEKVGEAWGVKAKAYTDRIVAALRYFGLMDYQGHGEGRRVAVSEQGRTYLRAQQDEIRQAVIEAAALRPKQIAKYWSEWGPDRPSDAACLDHLILVNSFSDAGAREFLKVYDQTISLLGAAIASTPPETSPGGPSVDPPPDTDHQATPAAAPFSEAHPHRPAAPGPSDPLHEERFVVDEGTVAIRFPQTLSAASVDELEAFFSLFIRKARRRAEERRNT